VVTDRYKIVQNKDAFSFTDALLDHDVCYETAGSLNDGKQVWMLARMPETEILGDKVDNFLVFSNSHDGKGAIRVAITPVRVVCQNTLNLAMRTAKRTWTTKHMGDMSTKLHEAQITLGLAEEYIKSLKITAEEMVKKTIYYHEFMEFVEELFPMPNISDISSRQESNVLELRGDLVRRYNAPDIDKFKDTHWGVVNALSDLVGHKEPQRSSSTFREKRFESFVTGEKIKIFDDGVYLLNSMAA
jgi:phage/plasmid-like protein (TIGR03299 family)